MSEFCERTGLTPREVRFLIAEGFMPSPDGGRAHATYGAAHLEAVAFYKDARRKGLKPSDIKKLRSPIKEFVVAEGISLLVDTTKYVDRDIQAVLDRLTQFIAMNKDEET